MLSATGIPTCTGYLCGFRKFYMMCGGMYKVLPSAALNVT